MNETLQNRRKLAYLINNWDDINLEYTENLNDISSQVIDFFKTESKLIYPAKTIFVAIIYAKCLEKYFNISFYDSLKDLDLLPDDKFFKKYTYNTHKDLYDYVLNTIGEIWQYPSIEKTVNYFKKEFLICN